MEERVVTNFPGWTLWVIALSQIIFALATALIAFAMISLLGQLKEILTDVREMEREVKGKMPSLMNNVDAAVNNVKVMSDDAATTTHHVTGTINRLSHVVGSVVGRLESPVVKSVGVLTGVAAGVKALRGGGRREREVIVERDDRKRRGWFGSHKK